MTKFHVKVEIEIDDAVNSDEAAAIALDILRNKEFEFSVLDEFGKVQEQRVHFYNTRRKFRCKGK